MAAPEGYTKLGTVGIAYKGEYSADEKANYKAMNWVTHEGSAWLVLKDNPTTAPPSEGDDWKLLAKKGDTGDKGDTGATPQITFTVQTGDPGTEVLVNQTGEPENPQVELTIPRGTPGEVTQAELEKAVAAATSKHWDIEVTSEGWQATAEEKPTFAGITAEYQNTVTSVEGMTSATDISGIVFLSGDRASAATWAWLAPGDGSVTLYAATQPSAAFSLRLTEVK